MQKKYLLSSITKRTWYPIAKNGVLDVGLKISLWPPAIISYFVWIFLGFFRLSYYYSDFPRSYILVNCIFLFIYLILSICYKTENVPLKMHFTLNKWHLKLVVFMLRPYFTLLAFEANCFLTTLREHSSRSG